MLFLQTVGTIKQMKQERKMCMDCAKIGALIAALRKEKGLTQKALANQLGISNKTVSKWECGQGCADLSYWPQLSAILGVDIGQMMEGEITVNQPDSGNIRRVRFYVCPMCGNILVSTGSAAVFCCGRKAEALTAIDSAENAPVTVEESDIDYYITVGHPMRKEHYLSFAAYVSYDRVILTRLYPEQSPCIRIPLCKGGKLYVYCVEDGLMCYEGLFFA